MISMLIKKPVKASKNASSDLPYSQHRGITEAANGGFL